MSEALGGLPSIGTVVFLFRRIRHRATEQRSNIMPEASACGVIRMGLSLLAGKSLGFVSGAVAGLPSIEVVVLFSPLSPMCCRAEVEKQTT